MMNEGQHPQTPSTTPRHAGSWFSCLIPAQQAFLTTLLVLQCCGRCTKAGSGGNFCGVASPHVWVTLHRCHRVGLGTCTWVMCIVAFTSTACVLLLTDVRDDGNVHNGGDIFPITDHPHQHTESTHYCVIRTMFASCSYMRT